MCPSDQPATPSPSDQFDRLLAQKTGGAATPPIAQAHVHGPDCNHDHHHHHHHAPVRKPVRPGRNEPCHCGSGRKYKKCCLATDAD